jgi:NAD(P)-dependent dehydrogenase (short-subunit alcohol dehydrogenase family)
MTKGKDYGLARLRLAASPLYLRKEEVQRGIDLMLLGHARLMMAADPIMRDAGLGGGATPTP